MLFCGINIHFNIFLIILYIFIIYKRFLCLANFYKNGVKRCILILLRAYIFKYNVISPTFLCNFINVSKGS